MVSDDPVKTNKKLQAIQSEQGPIDCVCVWLQGWACLSLAYGLLAYSLQTVYNSSLTWGPAGQLERGPISEPFLPSNGKGCCSCN